MDRAGRGQRAHRPHELGPRLFRRGAWWCADLRPWGGGRPTLRDPEANGWPSRGARTKERAAADRWRWEYVDHLEEEARRERLGLPRRHRALREAVDDYLLHRETVVEDNTLRNDHSALMHLLDFFGENAPAELTPKALQALVNRRLREGYSPGTVGKYARTIAVFGNWLGFPRLTAEVDLPNPGSEDTRTWTTEEIERLRAAADELDKKRRRDTPSARIALEAALATGARVGELFALEWKSFDPETRTVRIHRQLEEKRKRFKPLKGKRGRTAVVLPEWWAYHRGAVEGLLLPGRDGTPSNRGRRTVLRTLLDAADLNAPGLAWHSFRHTYARRFVEMGGRLEELQKSLGHGSITTTERVYGHLREDVAARLAVASIYGRPQLKVVQGGG